MALTPSLPSSFSKHITSRHLIQERTHQQAPKEQIRIIKFVIRGPRENPDL